MATKTHSLIAVLGAQLAGFRTGVNQAISLTNNLRSQSEAAFAAVDRAARKTASDMKSAFTAVDVAATRAGVTIGGIFAASTAGAGKTGFAFLKLQENALLSFTTILRDGAKAKALMRDLSDFAAKTPFELPGVVSAAQKFLAFGLEAEKVIPVLTAIGDAAAGLGGSPELIDRMTIAFGQMLAKGKIQAGEMLQLAEAGVPAWQALADAMGVDVATAMKMSENGLIRTEDVFDAFVQQIGGRFDGLMAQQSRKLGGLTSTLSDSFRGAAARIFEPLYDGLTDFLIWATGPRGLTMGDAISTLRKSVQQISDALFGFLKANGQEIISKVTEGYVFLAGALRDVILYLRESGPEIASSMKFWFGWLGWIAKFLADHPRLMTALIGIKLFFMTGIPGAILAVTKLFAGLSFAVLGLGLAIGKILIIARFVFGTGIPQMVMVAVKAIAGLVSRLGLLKLAMSALRMIPAPIAALMGGLTGKIVLMAKAIGLVNLAVASLKMAFAVGVGAMVGLVVYRLMPSIRAYNRELERGKKLQEALMSSRERKLSRGIGDANNIEDPAERRRVLQEQLDAAKKNLSGAQSGLANTKKKEQDESTTIGGLVGNKMQELNRKAVEEAEADLAFAEGAVSALEDELAGADGPGAAMGQAAADAFTAGLPPELQEAIKEFKDKQDAKENKQTPEQKASEDREKQVEEAMIRAAERDDESLEGLGDILGFIRDGASPNSAQSMALTFEGATPALASALAMALREGVDPQDAASEFVRRANANVAYKERGEDAAKATGNVRDEYQEKLPQEALWEFNYGLARLEEKFQTGLITEEEFRKGLEGIEAASKRAIEVMDTIGESEQDMGRLLKDGVEPPFLVQFRNLQTELQTGAITVDEFKNRFGELSDRIEAAQSGADQMGQIMDGLFDQTFANGHAAIGELQSRYQALHEALANGSLAIDDFKEGVKGLADQAERAAEAERQRRLLAGDFVGAGLDPQKAIMDRLAQMRMQQFNGMIDQVVSGMTGVGGMFQNIGDDLRRFSGSVQDFSRNMPSGQQVGDWWGKMVTFMNTIEGQRQTVLGQIQLFRQSLQLTSDALTQKDLQAKIDDLIRQLGLLDQQQANLPTFIGDRGDLDFKDPGTASGKSGGGGGSAKGYTPVSLSFPNLTRVSQSEAQVLADVVVREMERRGRSL